MTDPVWKPKLQYCPEAIQSNPRPFDDCSSPTPPGNGYRKISFFADAALDLQTDQVDDRLGLGFIVRPFGKAATGVWGLGGQWETNAKSHWTALGRLQTTFNLQGYGRDRFTVAALGGLHHQEDGENLGRIGMEAALEWRLIKSMTMALPFLSGHYTFRGSHSDQEEGSLWNLMVGARISFDFFPMEK
jgi:hypothetical protein